MHNRIQSQARWLLFLATAAFLLFTPASISADTSPLPPNTIQISQMMRELSAQPGFTDAMLAQLSGNKSGGALLTPALVDTMRKLILGRNWQGLDTFPGWDIKAINNTVNLGVKFLGRNDHPTPQQLAQYIDLGPYTIDQALTEDLDKPSNRPAFSMQGLVKEMGYNVQMGDGPDPRLAPLHSESARLAEVLNRLALNSLEDAKPFTVTTHGLTATTPEQLIANLSQAGDQITLADARYFANFGHLHSNGRDVAMPFMINTQILVPRKHFWQRRHALLTPVAHAEYEILLTNPKDSSRNADVTFFFGIDGKAEFRTNDQLNQPWVMGRHAHEYKSADALEVTRLIGLTIRMYVHEHLDHPELPFGGYYALGVCQDTVAAIEQKLTGHATLFPITRDLSLFQDTRDAEIIQLLRNIPDDRSGTRPPEPERIFGSLPTDNLATITIPGLADDLQRVHTAWQNGDLARPYSDVQIAVAALILLIGIAVFIARRKRRR